MGMNGVFFDTINTALGKGSVTGGYRTPAEQQALIASGATHATNSTHMSNDPNSVDGYDIAAGIDEATARRKLATQGLQVNWWHPEGGGPGNGTGAHTHIEVSRMGTNAITGPSRSGVTTGPATPGGVPLNSSGSGSGIVNPQAYLAALQSHLAPETASSQNVTSDAGAIFNSGPEVAKRTAAVDTGIDAATKGIAVLTQIQNAAHAAQTQALTTQVTQASGINQEMADGANQLGAKVAPVMAARGRIADQLDSVTQMNPLLRTIKGVFDLNYNKDYLTGQLDQYDRTLKARSDDYNYMQTLHQAALGAIDQRYKLDTAGPELAAKQAGEDLSTIGMGLANSIQSLSALKESVGTQTQMIQAQTVARGDMMARLDLPTINKLMAQAQANGGNVNYNGVVLNYNELRDKVKNDEHVDLAAEGSRMAIANGRMDMATKFANNIAESLTRPQAEAALAAGNVYNGIKLPADVLTRSYASQVQAGQVQAAADSSNLPVSQAYQVAGNSVGLMVALHNRSTSLFGPAGIPGAAQYMNAGTQLITSLKTAIDSNAPPEVRTAIATRIAQNTQAMNDAVKAGVLRQVGGDQKSADFLMSYMYGTPLDPGAAAGAMAHFAVKGALPAGMAVSDESRQVFQKAREAVDKYRRQGTPQGLPGRKLNDTDIAAAVTNDLTAAAPQMVGQARFDRIWQSLPTIAAKSGDPMGTINPAAWNGVRQQGFAAGVNAMARALNTTPDNVQKMASSGKPIDNTPVGTKLFNDFQTKHGIFNAAEQSATINGMNELPAIQPGVPNSQVLLNYLHSPKLHDAVSAYTSSLGSNSFGDYVVNPLSAGAVESMLSQHVDGLTQTQAFETQAARQSGREASAKYNFDPVMRSQVLLATIPGVNKDGAKALTPFVQSIVQQHPDMFPNGKIRPGVAMAGPAPFVDAGVADNAAGENSVILNALKSTKFQDPRLETYRKTAIAGWDEKANHADTFMDSFRSFLPSSLGGN